MNEEHMEVVMGLIMHGGNAKGYAYQAIQDAKAGNFDEADQKIELANQELKAAHDTQTGMLTQEAQGNHVEVDLYMVHGQDHLMNAITFKDLAVEIIELLRRLDEK
ncbi:MULTISPECIES: PTS lactose/cellobiose transporter subunit IIA [Periweissella]|uniref:PTS lactose/cellobiose transporter subunit IIA n=2 Tax=Periweissella TaxID=2930384 RepID=A0A7X6S237_9LACO|nr:MULTISPECIES: PTS lactose/cellobiose transporter subunit IIA [Periweissella]MCM0599350.1 PTS lactose/cellobiose transporter subunit IIA [Periweissella fabalis]MCM0600399.1 PTS lactose/cellobiose transporter subunit IIA [Periweissella ghanensis]NKZ23629.1 PTS lactose/cellobiose transporter subunit IIA [Periweissella fabalis]CAH0418137.1 PTS system cellobiose-specific EIIA component [Periweissella ghanensis]